jgi:predicted nuclease of restriction endonuclease-like (RecB) superfamily
MNEQHPKPRPQRPGDVDAPDNPAAGMAALPADYPRFLADVKARIAAARTRAVLAVNSELIKLYWEVGKEILDREDRQGWGAKVVDRLAVDLRRELPDITGFSPRSLRYMRELARAWSTFETSEEILQQPAAKLPWGHNMILLDKVKDADGRAWYASMAVENGWSRNVLQAQIATDLRGRQGNALTSFEHALPAPDSELVRDAIKDPYNFEFLGLAERAHERDLELALLHDIQSFLMSIGLVLCPGRRKTVTEWALQGIDTPVAIARYTTGDLTLTPTPPVEMKPALPDLPKLASELSDIVKKHH